MFWTSEHTERVWQDISFILDHILSLYILKNVLFGFANYRKFFFWLAYF